MRPRDLRSMWIPTPATKTQDPREVHDHDQDITGKDTNPFSEGRETQLYYGRGKTGVPGEKTAARTQMMCKSRTPGSGLRARGGTATTPTNLTYDFKSCKSEVGITFERRMISGCPSWTPDSGLD